MTTLDRLAELWEWGYPAPTKISKRPGEDSIELFWEFLEARVMIVIRDYADPLYDVYAFDRDYQHNGRHSIANIPQPVLAIINNTGDMHKYHTEYLILVSALADATCHPNYSSKDKFIWQNPAGRVEVTANMQRDLMHVRIEPFGETAIEGDYERLPQAAIDIINQTELVKVNGQLVVKEVACNS